MNNLQSNRTLVTGGSGFIGSALCWGLNQRGMADIVVSDHLGEDERWKNLVGLRFVDYVDADDLIERLEEDSDHLGKVSLVLHLGACSSTTERDAGYLMANNFEYTKRLAHWALDHGARFVYASSAATYGDGSRGMDDTDEDLHRLRPLNAYGYSKHLFDTYARATGISDSIIGLKYFNVFGPNENHKGDMRSLVNKSFDRIRETGKVQLFKSTHPDYRDGEQMRDFLYIKDAVEMTLHLALADVPAGLYNLGSGVASTWIELVVAIFEAMDLKPQIEFIEMPEALRNKYQNYTCADISKLRAAGYGRAVSPLSHAVADYVRNYLAADALLGTADNPFASAQPPPHPDPTASRHGQLADPAHATEPEPVAAQQGPAIPQPAPEQTKPTQPGTVPAFGQTPWLSEESLSPTEAAPKPFSQFPSWESNRPASFAVKPRTFPGPSSTPEPEGSATPQEPPSYESPQAAVFTPLHPNPQAMTPAPEKSSDSCGHANLPPRRERP